MSANTPEEVRNEQVIRSLYALAEGNAKDTSKFVSIFTDDGYFYDVAAAVPITWIGLSGEWQREWARQSTLADTIKIVAEHGGGSGVAFAWESQLLAAG